MHLLKNVIMIVKKMLLSKQKEIFDKTINEKLHGVQHINRKINYNDLRHYFKTKEKSLTFLVLFYWSLIITKFVKKR